MALHRFRAGIVVICYHLLIIASRLFAKDAVLKLSPHHVIRQTLSGGEQQLYQFKLQRSQFVLIVVEQQGIDVVLSLTGPKGGLPLITVDSPNGSYGPERLPFVADVTGRYTLEVRSLDKQSQPGQYETRIETLRTSQPLDRNLVAATSVSSAAMLLYDQNTKESVQEAASKWEYAVQLWHELEDREQEANSLLGAGWALRECGEPQKALDHYQQALPLYQAVRNREQQARLYRHIASAYDALEKSDGAANAREKSKELYLALGDKKNAAQITDEIGSAYAKAGKQQEALKAFLEELSLLRSIGDRKQEPSVLNEIGVAQYRQHNSKQAIAAYQEAEVAAQAVSDLHEEALALQNRALLRSLSKLTS